ncbi:hypothetical protein HanIR_Chr01g0026381 [Helianthus annuus]|nr:hypothetical protein HanIR_Chr01g0026381 [Helianthus annuus]
MNSSAFFRSSIVWCLKSTVSASGSGVSGRKFGPRGLNSRESSPVSSQGFLTPVRSLRFTQGSGCLSTDALFLPEESIFTSVSDIISSDVIAASYSLHSCSGLSCFSITSNCSSDA